MTEKPSLLTKWAENALELPEVRVQVRLRGNHLHILCEAEQCPPENYSVARFSQSLASNNIESLLPNDRKSPTPSRIYQIFVCGRALGKRRPDWTVKLDTNGYCPTFASFPSNETEVTRETAPTTNSWSKEEKPLVKSTATTIGESPTEVTLHTAGIGEMEKEKTSVLTATTPLQAEQAIGKNENYRRRIPSTVTLSEITDSQETEVIAKSPKEIATYLSEVLGGLGISVNVKIEENYKQKPETVRGVAQERETLENATKEAIAATNFKKSKTKKRLWVICEASYSPDPSLLAEPVAQRLRELKLKDFREGLILLQVRGEAKPDWMLRVDLTPSTRILQNYARWGEPAAIERLLQQELTELGIRVKATLKESTLHLFCRNAPNSKEDKAPEPEKAKEAIARLLSAIGPQGIKAATLYGVAGIGNDTNDPTTNSPTWIDWLNLPASQHPDLEPSAVALAKSGSNSALNYLLDKLLNPDLDRKLETGGIKAIVLPKAELLHVMTEAPTCPSQSKVAGAIAEFLRQLEIPGLTGVRVYGRRAGQKLPLWRYGKDFAREHRSSLEQVPEFAPSLADGEVALSEGEVSLLLPGQRGGKKQTTSGSLSTAIQQLLVASRLFVPAGAYSGAASDRSGARWLALVWAVLGLALTVQTDSFLGKFLQLSNDGPVSSRPLLASGAGEMREEEEPSAIQEERDNYYQLPALPWRRSAENPEGIFNESGFTKAPSLREETARKTQLLTIDYPSFNSKQLDEQLVRYQDYILANKRPPDVLIVGSSRALRGIDPTVLEESLASKGYGNLKIYNLGINGATVQLVDFILRQVLLPEQLPKLILFADGVRAFNSGREDRTFEIIASSEGYRGVIEGTLQAKAQNQEELKEEKKEEKIVDIFLSNYGKMKAWLNKTMQENLVAYGERDRFKERLVSLIKINEELVTDEIEEELCNECNELAEDGKTEINNGFLPISIKFDPDIYYQNHPKVSGDYDADYENFKLTGQQTTAINNLLSFTQARRIKVVFVNMPLTKEYLDAGRRGYELEFRQYMEGKAAEYPGLNFIDFGLLWPQAYENFSDPSHLNRYGAIAVAEELAEEPNIPWPDKNFRF